jgi:hypothetical protein
VEPFEDLLGAQVVGVTEHVAKVGQESDVEAGRAPLGLRYKRYSRYAGLLWPVDAVARFASRWIRYMRYSRYGFAGGAA